MHEIRDRLPSPRSCLVEREMEAGDALAKDARGELRDAAVKTVGADRAWPVPQLPRRLQLACADHRAVPAVDRQVDAGHVAGGVGCEEDQRAGELVDAPPCAALGYGSRSTPSCR